MSEVYDFLGREKIGNTEIIFYEERDNKTIILGKRYTNLIPLLSRSFIMRKFRKIEICFVTQHLAQKHLAEGKNPMPGTSKGYVREQDKKSGRNRVFVHEDVIIAKIFKRINAKEKVKTSGRRLYSEISPEVLSEAAEVVFHELTHLWHSKVNDDEKILAKVRHRIRKTQDDMNLKINLFELSNEVLERLFTSGGIWLEFRAIINILLQLIIREGLARFVQYFDTGKIEHTEISLRRSYNLALQAAEKTNRELENIYQDFIEFAKAYKRSGKRHPSSDIMRAMDRSMKLGFRAIHKNNYDIGCHVYQMILMQNPKINLDRLASLKYPKLFRLYEEACREKGWQPIVSWSKEGIFSYKKQIHRLKKLSEKVTEIIK